MALKVGGSIPLGHPNAGQRRTSASFARHHAPLAQWQSNGLLIRRFWVRIPGGAPERPGQRHLADRRALIVIAALAVAIGAFPSGSRWSASSSAQPWWHVARPSPTGRSVELAARADGELAHTWPSTYVSWADTGGRRRGERLHRDRRGRAPSKFILGPPRRSRSRSRRSPRTPAGMTTFVIKPQFEQFGDQLVALVTPR